MSSCYDCHLPFGCQTYGSPCSKCKKLICSNCAGTHALIPFDEKNPDESNDLTKNNTIESYCKACYQEVSVLDYSKSYDEYVGSRNDASITLLVVHRGGGSRAMYRPHAQDLAKKGYRCILMDLPGHGTLVDTPLTLDSCVEATRKVYDECSLKPETTIYVGASLGAYIGFFILTHMSKRFCGAIMMDCGQNVGPDCSLKARLGIWFLKMTAGNISNKAMMNSMMGVIKKSLARYKLVESTLGAGMHFQQGIAQVLCIHTVAPAEHISNYDFPLLFFNGSEVHRDSEDKWLSLCKDQKRSSLKVYEGGDHFFTHDARFVDDLIARIDAFAKQAVSP